MRADRHGRAARADNDPRRRPSDGFRVRDTGRFRRVVADALADLPERLAEPLRQAAVVVVPIPPEGARRPDGDVPLASFSPPVLTVYRRPLESRAGNHGELEEGVRIAVGEAVALALGLDDDLDDLYGGEP